MTSKKEGEEEPKEILVHYTNPETLSQDSIPNRQRYFVRQRSLSQYAVSLPQQPTDISVIQTKDDHYCFFAKGRDFQPHTKQHKYTAEELRILETYEGSSRLPSNSQIYREWSSTQPYKSLEKISWGTVILIALLTGLLAFAMKELCEKFQIFHNPFIEDYIDRGQPYRLLMYHAGISCSFVCISSLLCVYSCPWAAGSGIPEIICILNGTVVRNVLTVKTLLCKTFSIAFAVLSGIPIGFEGPMVHIGGMIGGLLSKPVAKGCPCKSRRVFSNDSVVYADLDRHNSKAHPCCRYRDCEERHSLICLGAACGIASAFSAPISALLFVFEEIATHWNSLLTWKAFVCCIVARSVTEGLRTGLACIIHYKTFRFFELSEGAVFDVRETLALNALMLIPAIAVGIIGGILGAIFVFIHLKMARIRRRFLAGITCKEVQSVVKVLEPVLIALLSSIIIMATLPYFKCLPVNHEEKRLSKKEGKFLQFHGFRCEKPLTRTDEHNKIIQSGEYHEAATLLFGSWEQMVRNLLSRKTPKVFSISILTVIFFFFFFFSSWASLTSIASGLLIPQLAIGALYGRIIGVVTYNLACKFVDVENLKDESEIQRWEWADPGAFSLLGAAGFLAGTTRLPITSVVILIEMTNDVDMCLLIMIVVMLARAIGDYFTHSLYHSLIEFKCIPFLQLELDIVINKKKLNLDLLRISEVMASPVSVLKVQESIQVLANILLDTNHCGFPVVQPVPGLPRTFLGTITRMELTILLTKTASFNADELQRECREQFRLSYPDYSTTKIKDTLTTNMILNNYASDERYQNVTVNLMPYVNISAHSVKSTMSLLRSYTLFRSEGLRHLVVTDHFNQVIGIVTRKDFMGHHVFDKLKKLVRVHQPAEETVQTQSTSTLETTTTKLRKKEKKKQVKLKGNKKISDP